MLSGSALIRNERRKEKWHMHQKLRLHVTLLANKELLKKEGVKERAGEIKSYTLGEVGCGGVEGGGW